MDKSYEILGSQSRETNMRYTVEAVQFYGVGLGVNGSGRRPLLRGFCVVQGTRRRRAFTQGSAQKWTPELEASLRKQAEDWAAVLERRYDAA